MWVALGSAALQLCWFAFWGFTVGAVYFSSEARQLAAQGGQGGQGSQGGREEGAEARLGLGFFGLLLSLFWTSQVIKNVSHTTTAGVVAAWWFQTDRKHATKRAFVRAITTSFGSICLGSLIVAFLQAVRAVCRMARESARKNRESKKIYTNPHISLQTIAS